MKYTTIFFILIILTHSLYAQKDTTYREGRPKVGLVLSGGGSHGLAHIGVIRLLEELEIPIDYIAGTSMGSIVGSLAAMGYTSYEIEELALSLNWDRVFNNDIQLYDVAPADKLFHASFPVSFKITNKGLGLPMGAFNSNNLDVILSRLYSPAYDIKHFDQLPIPFRCTATDIAACEAVEIDSGSLQNAIRCSMSIPSVFSPVRDGKKLYVDGGVANNFPVNQVRAMGADIVIGSYVGAKMLNADELESMADILKQVGFFQSLQDFKQQKDQLDVLIQPKVKMVSSFNFDLDHFFIEQGYEAAIQAKNKLKILKDSFDLQANKIAALQRFDSITIDEVTVRGLSTDMADYLMSRLDIPLGSKVSLNTIENNLHEVNGTRIFEALTYDLQCTPSGDNRLLLTGKIRKKALMGLSLNRFKSTGLGIIVGARIKNYGLSLSDINIHTRLSEFPGVFARFTKRGNRLLSGFVWGLDAKAEVLNFPIFVQGKRRQENNLIDCVLSPLLMYEFNSALSTSLRYNYTYQRYGDRVVTSEISDNIRYQSKGMQLILDYNTLNRVMLPLKGVHAQISGMYLHNISYALPKNEGTVVDDFSSTVLKASIRHVIGLTDYLSVDYDTGIYWDNNYGYRPLSVGGSHQGLDYRVRHIGLPESGLHLFDLAYFNVGIRYKLAKSLYIIPTLSLSSAIRSDVIRNAWGVQTTYISPIGPISFSVGSSMDRFKLIPLISIGRRYIF